MLCRLLLYTLLGQKVSHLGLSTHKEKVQAIMDLACPTSISDLQKFLGMVVYFSTYIPFYSMITSPLFDLLKKGVKWQWHVEQETAYEQAKEALANAPVLGHLISNQAYRLYTDASDLALGASLQQVQTILVRDRHTLLLETGSSLGSRQGSSTTHS